MFYGDLVRLKLILLYIRSNINNKHYVTAVWQLCELAEAKGVFMERIVDAAAWCAFYL